MKGQEHPLLLRPPELPWALTVCCLLHQPPILTEVVCGFAQEAAHGVILEGGEARYGYGLSPARRKVVWSGSSGPQGARLRLGAGGAQGARALGPCPAAPWGRVPDFPVMASSIGSLHRAPRATL